MQGGSVKLPNTGARQAPAAVDKSSPETLKKSPRRVKGGERYSSGGWDELAAASTRAQKSGVAHPAKWGAAKVAKQDSVWTESISVPQMGNSSDGGTATSRAIASGNAAGHSKPSLLSPEKPGVPARGLAAPSPRTNALRAAAAASSGEVAGVIGAARERIFAQISRCMSDPHRALAGQSGEEASAAGEPLRHEQGGDVGGEEAKQKQKKRNARNSLRATKLALSMGKPKASSRAGAKPAASQSGAPSSKRSKGMGLWEGVLGHGHEEEEPSRLMEGYTSKLKTKVNIMSEASYLIDKKYQRRRSSISSSRRGSLISNASDDKPDKPNMASVVLDHIQHRKFRGSVATFVAIFLSCASYPWYSRLRSGVAGRGSNGLRSCCASSRSLAHGVSLSRQRLFPYAHVKVWCPHEGECGVDGLSKHYRSR